MFDNLREQANATPFYEEEAQSSELGGIGAPRRKAAGGPFLGMTAVQRFIVAIMLMIVVCVLGTVCLLVTGRISLI